MRAKGYPGWKPSSRQDKRHRGRKLTERQVRLIKADRISKYRVLAERFEVSVYTIGAIKAGTIWKHII